MPITLDGTNGLSDVDGSASTPAIRGTDTNTGIFFPAADTIAFSEGGTEVMRIDSSGNVGIGTSSPTQKLDVDGSIKIKDNYELDFGGTSTFIIGSSSSNYLRFYTNTTERMRIDSSGNVLVGITSSLGVAQGFQASASGNASLALRRLSDSGHVARFLNFNSTQVGSIGVDGSSTSYNTSSDYRLKENIAPMTGALEKIQALKPVSYKWKIDGSVGEGFIAHELAEVAPACVSGEKDAVDAEGNPVYQGVDTSFLVATLTAALQELNAKVEAQAIEIAELKAGN
jgi:hypothetical protein